MLANVGKGKRGGEKGKEEALLPWYLARRIIGKKWFREKEERLHLTITLYKNVDFNG